MDKRISVDAMKLISSSKLHKELLKFEEGCVRNTRLGRMAEIKFSAQVQHVYRYKFGVLFCRQGQTKENDMFSNS